MSRPAHAIHAEAADRRTAPHEDLAAMRADRDRCRAKVGELLAAEAAREQGAGAAADYRPTAADDDGALVNPYPAERAAYHWSWREGWRAGARVIIAERERDAALLRAAELQAKLSALEARHNTHDNNPDRSDL